MVFRGPKRDTLTVELGQFGYQSQGYEGDEVEGEESWVTVVAGVVGREEEAVVSMGVTRSIVGPSAG